MIKKTQPQSDPKFTLTHSRSACNLSRRPSDVLPKATRGHQTTSISDDINYNIILKSATSFWTVWFHVCINANTRTYGCVLTKLCPDRCAGRDESIVSFGETGLICWLYYKKLVTSTASYFSTVMGDDLSISNPFSTPDFCSSSSISEIQKAGNYNRSP